MRRIALPASGKKGGAAVSAGLLAGGRLAADASVTGEAAGAATAAFMRGTDGNGLLWGGAGGKGVVAAAGVGAAVAAGTKRAARKGPAALIVVDIVSVTGPAAGLAGVAGGAAAANGASTGLASGLRGDSATGGGVGAAGAGWEAGTGFVGDVVAESFSLVVPGIAAFATASSSMLPVPLSSQGNEISGKAPIMRCTTSRLGLLRSLRMWLTTGRPTPIRSAN